MVTDSGGMRELLIDRAQDRAIPLAKLSETTKASLREMLPANLPPSNPLDCAGTISDRFARPFEQGFRILADAPEVAMVGYEVDARDDHVYVPELLEFAHKLPAVTGKPCFAYSSFSRTHNRGLAASLADAGVPQLNGLDETLSAIAAMRKLRDLKLHLGTDDPPPQAPEKTVIQRWRRALGSGEWQGDRHPQ